MFVVLKKKLKNKFFSILMVRSSYCLQLRFVYKRLCYSQPQYVGVLGMS